jgi:hypothetical protein
MAVGVEKVSPQINFLSRINYRYMTFFFILVVLFNPQIRFGKEGWSIEKHTVPVK